MNWKVKVKNKNIKSKLVRKFMLYCKWRGKERSNKEKNKTKRNKTNIQKIYKKIRNNTHKN